MPRPMKIGELARKTGKTVRALHLYEEMKLLLPDRSEGGFRLYRPDHVARVAWINKLQAMGFKLSQIRGLLEAVEASNSAPGAMDGVRELFGAKLSQTREQVRHLLELETDLTASLAYLEACRGCSEASSEACAECDDDRHVLPGPGLVTGLHLGRRGEDGAHVEICESDKHSLPTVTDTNISVRQPATEAAVDAGTSAAGVSPVQTDAPAN